MGRIFDQILQVGFVADDLDAAVKRYHDVYGVGPWQIYELPDYRVAFCNALNVQWKILQPRGEEGVFAAFLRGHGPIYAHHVMVRRTVGFGPAIEFLKGQGRSIVYENELPTGEKYCYFDTSSDLAMSILLTERNTDVRALGVGDDAIPGRKAATVLRSPK